MKNNIIIIFFTLLVHIVHSAQFAYPVADLGDDNLFVLHQRSVDNVELWSWSTKTKLAIKELSSMFIPTDVQLMPEGKSFSFLDRGRIWVKSFCKRMPRSIDILEPIDSIFSVKWLTDDICYFSGRHYRTYDVFLCDISTGLQPDISFLTHTEGVDVLYPCKYKDNLFCVVRDNLDNYSFVKFDWDPVIYNEGFDFSKESQTLYVSDDPICSLSVSNNGCGILISCISELATLEDFLVFSCNIFNCSDDTGVVKAFEFSLPTAYILSGSRSQLRDSIARFLPHYIEGRLYFSSYDQDTGQLHLYEYSQGETKRVSCKKSLESFQQFAPIVVDGKLYSGIISPKLNKKNLLDFDEKTGEMRFELPMQNV